MLIWLPTLEIWRYRKFPSYSCELAFITPCSLLTLFIFILPCEPIVLPRFNRTAFQASLCSTTKLFIWFINIRARAHEHDVVHRSKMARDGAGIAQNLWRCEDNSVVNKLEFQQAVFLCAEIERGSKFTRHIQMSPPKKWKIDLLCFIQRIFFSSHDFLLNFVHDSVRTEGRKVQTRIFLLSAKIILIVVYLFKSRISFGNLVLFLFFHSGTSSRWLISEFPWKSGPGVDSCLVSS